MTEVIVIKSHTKMLEHMGYIVEVAEDGQKALIMGQGDYDLIFMDIGLPYLSSFEVTSRLRQLGIKKPTIGLTAYDKHEVEADCLSSGTNTVLVKPVAEGQRKSVIEDYVHLQYYSNHNSSLDDDSYNYIKKLKTIVGLGFTIILIDDSFVSAYEPYLVTFFSIRYFKRKVWDVVALSLGVANIVSVAIFISRFVKLAFYPSFAKTVEEVIMHATVQKAGKIEEAKRLVRLLFKDGK